MLVMMMLLLLMMFMMFMMFIIIIRMTMGRVEPLLTSLRNTKEQLPIPC